MARKLDRKRPFAEIYGAAAAKYEQFGIQFDAEGSELEGFEGVEVPADIPVITVDSDQPALRAEIVRLAGELARVTAELEEKDAEFEEVQGKLDTAQVEISRLTVLVEEAKFPDPPKKGGKAATSVDAQLEAQQGTL